MQNSNIQRDSKYSYKLRHLKPNEHDGLLRILSCKDAWLILAGFIRDPDNENEFLYTTEDIMTFENQNKPIESFWNDWIYRGRNQATIEHLLKYLNDAQLLRAVNYVKTELLKLAENLPASLPHTDAILDSMTISNHSSKEIDSINDLLEDIDLSEIRVYDFNVLQNATADFCDISIENGGCKIGEGAYGTVFKAVLSDVPVAVKKLKDVLDQQFFTELQILTRFKHDNLLPLLGCSINGSSCCIIYKYMENGSLQERLACDKNISPIPSSARLSIVYGTALGINCLHTIGPKPMIHRDIKSANILLDKDFTPKIGDFGLVRIGSGSSTVSYGLTKNVYGTRMYMPIEAFSGDVSVKLDAYSFGVVLLEILTGLPPYDPDRDGIDLVSHMENFDDIFIKLDSKVEWDNEKVMELYKISQSCLARAKKNRCTISEILPALKNCCTPNETYVEEVFV